METKTIVPRAERVTVQIPITYRMEGDDHWFQSRVMNMSDTGVLFGPTALEPGTPLEMIFSPPIQIGTMAPGQTVCVGSVVRTTELGIVGARFQECRFLLEP
jgi:hypothetical protein